MTPGEPSPPYGSVPGADGDPNKDGPGRRLAYAVIAGLFGAMLLWAALDAALRAWGWL